MIHLLVCLKQLKDIAGITESPSGWFVHSKGNDEKLEVDADIILGCDGAYSALRRELMRRPRWGMQGIL